jgi:hypothetical protein
LSYENKRQRENERQRRAARDAQDIGPLPPVIDQTLRDAADGSFRRFCEACFPQRFPLAWSANHLLAIERIEQVVAGGGLYALAMPRGTGKTTLCEAAVLWATSTGRKRCALLVGADKASALKLIESIKGELEANDEFLSLYPEVCFPIHCLEGQTNRAKGQKLDGERTKIGWKASEVILPCVPGAASSGAAILVRSIAGGIRGLKLRGPDGEQIRPDLFLLDDPQTDASAKSERQTNTRIATITKVLRFLSGPGVRMSGLMPCTIIRRGDLAARFLDRDSHPEWHGQITKMLDALPTAEAMELWWEYARIRDEDLRRGGDAKIATTFYRDHRQAMHDGAIVTWPERFEPHQLSGLQFAMDWLTARDPDAASAFWSECQNEPQADAILGGVTVEAETLPGRVLGIAALRLPDWATHVTAAIDVQHKVLYYMVCAWGPGLRGHVLCYGAWPDQRSLNFTSRNPPIPIASQVVGTLDRQLAYAIDQLGNALLSTPFQRATGAKLSIGRLFVDAADGHATDVVISYCDDPARAATAIGVRGVGIGPADCPMREWKFDPADVPLIGLDWVAAKMKRRNNRHLRFDANSWKSRVARGLNTAIDSAGAITVYGDSSSDHRPLWTHWLSEEPDKQTSDKTGRSCDVWRKKPNHNENHWWDTLTMCAVAASTLGLEPSSAQ